MAGTAISVGLKLLDLGLKLGGVFDSGDRQVREDIKAAVSDLKAAIADSKKQIMSAVGEAVAQGEFDQYVTKIRNWLKTYQDEVDLVVKGPGPGEQKRIEPSDSLRMSLSNPDTGIDYLLYRMHNLLVGTQSRKTSLIQLSIQSNLDEPLCSEAVEYQHQGIAWYLESIRKYLEMQFQVQACGFALSCLITASTSKLAANREMLKNRFIEQEATAWEAVPALIKAMKKDLNTPMSSTHFWRFEKEDNQDHWLAIGARDELWHEPNVNGPHTQWRFENKDRSLTSLETDNQVYVVSRSYPQYSRIIRERYVTRMMEPEFDYKWYLERMEEGEHWWRIVAAFNDKMPNDRNHLILTRMELAHKDELSHLHQAPILIKVAPVKGAQTPQFRLVPVITSLTKFGKQNASRPRTEVHSRGVFNTIQILTDKDVDQGPLVWNNGPMFGGKKSYPGY